MHSVLLWVVHSVIHKMLFRRFPPAQATSSPVGYLRVVHPHSGFWDGSDHRTG